MVDGTNEHDAGADAASGFLCGVCDTPLPAGADHCISCGTPVVWLDEDTEDDNPTAASGSDSEVGAEVPRGPSVEPTPVSVGDSPSATTERAPAPLNAAAAAAAGGSVAAASRAPAPAAPSGPINAGPAPATTAGKGEHTTLLIGVAVIVVALVVAGFIVVSGSKKDDTKTAAATTATTTVSAPPTTAASVTPTAKTNPTAKAPPTTKATPTTNAEAPTTTAADKTAAFCAASKIYTVTDVVTLGNNAVKDPDGQIKAYNDFLANAPDDLKDEVQSMGGLTKKSVAKVKSGEITTPQELQQYIASEPPDDVVKWIAAQQKVVPELQQLCA